MGTVKRLAEEVKRGLDETHPELRKPVVSKLALAVAAMIEGRTPNVNRAEETPASRKPVISNASLPEIRPGQASESQGTAHGRSFRRTSRRSIRV